jgi:hypothetical protein
VCGRGGLERIVSGDGQGSVSVRLARTDREEVLVEHIEQAVRQSPEEELRGVSGSP